MNGRKRIAICISFGPEVRAFLYSGLARRLAGRYDIILIVHRTRSAAFAQFDDFTIAEMPNVTEHRRLGQWRSLAYNAQVEWLRAHGRAKWSHYLNGGRPKLKIRVLRAIGTMPGGLDVLAPSMTAFERWLGRSIGTNHAWKQLLTEMKIDGLLSSSASSPRTLPSLQTAANMGIKTIVATNSWKDVYTTTNLPVVPTRLVLWSQRAADDLIAMNPHVENNRVVVGGSLHLEPFLHPASMMNRHEFCSKQGLDPSRPFICYSTAAPTAVLNEDRIVRVILDAIRTGEIPGHPQLLIRLNPMESGSRFQGLKAEYGGDVVIQKPDWEFDPQADWCCALPSDVPWWVATAFHSALNVSISSTVTMEFGVIGRPVVNVCFDLPAPLPAEKSNRRFWDADFYAETRELGLATPAFTAEELIRHISRIVSAPRTDNTRTAASDSPSPVNRLMAVFEEVMGT